MANKSTDPSLVQNLEIPAPVATKKVSPAPTSSPQVQGSYATEYFKKTGIPYCELCGEQFHNNLDGSPVCPENFSSTDCPRLKG